MTSVIVRIAIHKHGVADPRLLTPCPSDSSLTGEADEVLDDTIKIVSSQLDAPAVWPHDNERGVVAREHAPGHRNEDLSVKGMG